jgi:hypothetical protein
MVDPFLRFARAPRCARFACPPPGHG